MRILLRLKTTYSNLQSVGINVPDRGMLTKVTSPDCREGAGVPIRHQWPGQGRPRGRHTLQLRKIFG